MKKIEPIVHDHKITDWLNDYKDMLLFFSAEDIDEAIQKSPYTDYTDFEITTTEYFQYPPGYLSQFERTLNNIPRIKRVSKVNTHGRNETIEIKTWEYRIRSNYQGNINEFIIRYCLNKTVPFFRLFKWSIHSIGYHTTDNYEIYLKTGYADDLWDNELSLYVPVKALLAKDWKAIEQRNINYWKMYCNPSDELWAGTDKTRQQYYDSMLEVFKTPAVINFKKMLKAWKQNNSIG